MPVLGELTERKAPAASSATLSRLGEMIRGGGQVPQKPPPPRRPRSAASATPPRRPPSRSPCPAVQFVAPLTARLDASLAVETRDSTIDTSDHVRSALEIEEGHRARRHPVPRRRRPRRGCAENNFVGADGQRGRRPARRRPTTRS
ncbi:MAG: hypothetical protein R3F65_18140 [bacterium]